MTPIAVTSTVTLHPNEGRFEVAGTWTLANDGVEPLGAAAFELLPDVELVVSSSVGRVRVDRRTVVFEPPIATGARRSFAFEIRGAPERSERIHLDAEEVFLDGGAGPVTPVFDGPARVNVCVRAPAGWFVAVPGDPTTETCGSLKGTQPTIVAARRRAFVLHEGRFVVAVAPEHAAAARPLLDEVRTIVEATEARYGPGATRALDVVELSIESAFSMNGVIVLHPGVATAIAEDGREAPFLAHEIGHQWFGSLANGAPAYREGLASLMALEHARRRGDGDTYVEALLEREQKARRGMTIRGADPDDRWSDYDAVAYARAALAWDRLQQSIGRERFDALVRRYIDTFRGRRGTLDDFLGPLETIAPAFDRAGFVAKTIDADWDPATDTVRPPAPPFGAITVGVVLVALIVGVLLVRRRLVR